MDISPSAQAIVASLNAKFSPSLAFHVGWDIRYGAKGRRTRRWHIDVVVPGATNATAIPMQMATAGAVAMPMATAGAVAMATPMAPASMMVDTTGDGQPDTVVQVAPAAPVQPTVVMATVMATPVVVQAAPMGADRV